MELKNANDNAFTLKGGTCFRLRKSNAPSLIGISSALLKCSIAVLFVWIIAGAVVPTGGNDFCKSKTTCTHFHDKFKKNNTPVLSCKAYTGIHSLSLPVNQKKPCCKKRSHKSKNVEPLMTSTSTFYTLLVNFRYGVDVEAAYQDVLAAMGRVARKLPPGMDPPIIIKADPSQLPVMQITLSSDQHDLVWLRDWVDNWLTDRITAVNGTAGVEVVGGAETGDQGSFGSQETDRLQYFTGPGGKAA